jgi:hypothetical protein
MARAAAALALGLAALAGAARADEPAVKYEGGALSVRCADAPLAEVLERIKTAAGVALIVESAGGTTKLTADVPPLPFALAIARLLEGTGVGYVLVEDPADPWRVKTVYVTDAKPAGAAASGPRTAGAVPTPAVVPPPVMTQPIPDPLPRSEPADADDDDEEVSTDTPTVAAEPAAPVAPTPGFHPVLDPFGRPIPVKGGADNPAAAARRARRGDRAQ